MATSQVFFMFSSSIIRQRRITVTFYKELHEQEITLHTQKPKKNGSIYTNIIIILTEYIDLPVLYMEVVLFL